MSATNRGAERCEADYYPTPAWCVHRLLEACPLPGGEWLEPAAGDGAIMRAVNAVRSDVRWQAIELRQDAAEKLMIAQDAWSVVAGDFLRPEEDDIEQPVSVIITNPPYSLAQAFVERSLQVAHTVAMLLRLNYLGSEARAPFWYAHPPDVYVLPNRPSFVNGRTDATEYAWFVWSRARTGPGTIQVLARTPKSERCGKAPAPAVRRDEDTIPRAPGCQCHLEVGDSPCRVHGDAECERCGQVYVEAKGHQCQEPAAATEENGNG